MGLLHLDPLAEGTLKNAVLETRRPSRAATERHAIEWRRRYPNVKRKCNVKDVEPSETASETAGAGRSTDKNGATSSPHSKFWFGQNLISKSQVKAQKTQQAGLGLSSGLWMRR